ncbi:hypothetical protein LUZ61_000551 [Rhynchospora tenuis]|uniref:Uncharacterized protein n=1 Tax=Rhynchospora tenuis TaxID=198213 RepID=A0AAD5ZFK8_9POAL|nr:hypothetical protein LUZ61_000551 [Rhynchospora tenuis]
MATFIQGAQNENVLIHRGKAGNELKPALPNLPKTAKKPLGKAGERPKTERKALGDLSNISKPPVSTRVRKNLSSVLKSSENTKSSQKSTVLTEEQTKKCQEWSHEGIERMYFTGNDIQKLERDCMEKRVKEEVSMVTSSMHRWGNDMFDLISPMKDGISDSGLKLEFEPEILSSKSDKRRCDRNKLDCLLDEPEEAFQEFNFKLDSSSRTSPTPTDHQ